MPIKHLETILDLPPGRPPCPVVGEFLNLFLREFRWFEPRRYGSSALDQPIDPSRIDLGALVAHYEEHGTLFVAARTDRDFVSIYPITTGAPPYTGAITWMTSASMASKASWRADHAKQVLEVMRLFQVPLALSGLKTDLHAKRWRLIPKSISREGGKEFTYSTQVFTVRDYSEGLAGLFWRNFYGPPFVRMFGERLDALPPECRQTLGAELVLVQPYELPSEAGTEAGMARERELISLLGPECFYDHERHTLPTRWPVLDSLGQPLH